MKRMWINQPSTHQPLHHLHGTNVLAEPEYGYWAKIYFLSGDTISQQCHVNCLSEGWQPERDLYAEGFEAGKDVGSNKVGLKLSEARAALYVLGHTLNMDDRCEYARDAYERTAYKD